MACPQVPFVAGMKRTIQETQETPVLGRRQNQMQAAIRGTLAARSCGAAGKLDAHASRPSRVSSPGVGGC